MHSLRCLSILFPLFCMVSSFKLSPHLLLSSKSAIFLAKKQGFTKSYGFSSLMTTRGGMRVEVMPTKSSLFLSVNEIVEYVVQKPLLQDTACAMFSAVAALFWVRIWEYLASRGDIDPKISRKIIHCGSGPLFLLVWPFFSAEPLARYFAAGVPLIQVIRLWKAGGSDSTDENPNSLVKAISRTGAAEEVLGGPFIYCLVLLAATLVFWRDSLVGVMAVCQMAAGDGMADIVGRKFGTVKWPWSEDKSIAGSMGFVAGGFLVTVGVVAWLHFAGCLSASITGNLITQIALISLISAAVEVVPFAGDDNISVPLSAGVLAYLMFYTSFTAMS